MQARITPCLVTALVPIAEAVQAGSNANANSALLALAEEAAAEYEAAALRPILTPAVNGIHRLLRLPLSPTLRSRYRDYLTGIATWTSLNVCTDAEAWYAAGLGAGQEPPGTAQTTVAAAEIDGATATNGKVKIADLRAAQQATLKQERALARKHFSSLSRQAEKAFRSWLGQLLRSINSAIPTTTTTTTTTTGTQTTP